LKRESGHEVRSVATGGNPEGRKKLRGGGGKKRDLRAFAQRAKGENILPSSHVSRREGGQGKKET